MRTSHKPTHTRLGQVWLRWLALSLLLSGLSFAAYRALNWSAQANGIDAASAQLKEAKARFLAQPSQENSAKYDNALKAYRAALKANPVATSAAQSSDSTYSSQAYRFIETPPLSEVASRQLDPVSPKKLKQNKNEQNELPIRADNGAGNRADDAIQNSIPPGQNAVSNPIQNFDGPDMDTGNGLFGGRFAPPDTNADVGPNHVVVTTNGGVTIYNKSGTVLVPQFRMSQVMAGIASAADDDGDPVVLYDPLADRWLLTQFGISTITNNSTHELIAVSKTGDPTGAYYAYDFLLTPNRFGDYPHLGVWPDGYYMSTNDFNLAGTAFLGAGLYAFERSKMLAGDPTAKILGFNTGTADGGMLPTDLDGVVAPPAGTPNLFIEFDADEFGAASDLIRVWQVTPNFTTNVITATALPDIPTAAFDASQPSSRAVVEQPSPAVAADNLDAIADRLMHRLAYRTLSGGTQSYVLNFTVNVSGVAGSSSTTYQAGVRWMELRRNAGTGAITINQQSTYAPGSGNGATGRNLWMASVAQDGEGNIGLAANASSTTLIPTAIYTGRLAGDPASTLPQGEVDAMAAVTRGVQTGTSNRWGDYSSLSVDPADECTFWGAFEYVDAPTASFDWNSRVFSFKVNPSCVTAGKGSIAGVATNPSLGGAPISGVSVTATGGLFRSTDASGAYSFTSGAPSNLGLVAPGTYTVTCSKTGYTTVSGSVTVTAGATATFNCAMQGAPIINLVSNAITAEDCATDGKADPGETISLQVCLNNTGGANPANLVATLAATGGVTNPSAPQSYGVVTAGGGNVCRTFTFRVNPAQVCGANVVATFNLADGANNLGSFTVTLPSGTNQVSFTENFNGVTAPALPSGWVATNVSGAAPLWVTSTTSPSSAPNALFVDDPATVSEKVIESPAIAINSAAAILSFKHTFAFESGFDGGVLEASINGGAYVDVTSATAGGTFTAGAYNGAISTSFSNPIGGRSAWTGTIASGFNTYETVTVQFGAALQGKTVKFRWRMGSDTSATGSGWRVDDVQVLGDLLCCVKITPTASLSDPLVCTGPGNVVSGVANVVNPTANTLTGGTVNIALPAGLVGVSCTANVGTCVASATGMTWTGSLAGNSTLTINYTAQVGNVNSGTQLCATVSGGFGTLGLNTVTACLTVNCQPLGPGNLPGTANNVVNDQRGGSVLFYNVYTSTAGTASQDTRISITNTEPSRISYVHLFFVDGSTCSVADAYICLTPNQTASFLASDLDPGTTGYLVAVATNRSGCPINFNYLIGDEYVKFTSGHQANLGAEAMQAIAGGTTACDPTATTATLNFNGVNYTALPRVLALDNVGSRADGNDTLVIVNSVGGDLRAFAQTLRPLFGVLYDDAEVGTSFTFSPGTCQFRGTVNNNFPKTTPRFETAVPAGRSAWMKFWVNTATAAQEPILGASINRNPNSAANSGAFNQGHNLHKLNISTGGTLTIPVLPATCQ